MTQPASMSRAEGRRRLPKAREFLILVAISHAGGATPKKELRKAVAYYQECVKAAESGKEIQ